MGNRGRLHEGRGARDIVRNHQTKTWIILGPRLYGQTMGYLPTAIAPAALMLAVPETCTVRRPSISSVMPLENEEP